MGSSRPKRFAKVTKKLSKTRPEQYLGLALKPDSKLSVWRLKYAAELQLFCI